MNNIFNKGIVRIFFSSIGIQTINILLLPIITRLYSPEDFGKFGIVTSAVMIAVAISGLKFEQGILVAQNKVQAFNLFLISNLLSLLINSVIFFLVLYFSFQEKGYYLYIPIISFFSFFTESYYLLSSRCKDFTILPNGKLLGAISSNIVKLSVSKNSSIYDGLIFGQLIGVLLPTVYILAFKLNVISQRMRRSVSLKKTFIKKISYPIYYLPQGILNVLSHNYPPLVLSLFFSEYRIGLLWFCIRVLQIPLSVISDAVRQVITVKLTTLKSSISDFEKEWKKWTLILSVLSLLAILFINLTSRFLFPFVFGDEWIDSYYYANWLVFYAVSGVFIIPTVSALLIWDKLKNQLYFETFQFMIITIVLVYSIFANDIELFIVLFSLSRFVLSVMFVIYYIFFTKRREHVQVMY